VILTAALNATVNVSYEAAEIAWGAPNHISRMTCRAGGGSLAVARVLAGLGEDVLVAGFAGGGAGNLIEADLARAGVATAFTTIGRESRRVIEVLDEAREQSTRLTEPAPGLPWPAAIGPLSVWRGSRGGRDHQGLGVPFPKIRVCSCRAVSPVPQTAGGSLPLTAAQFVHATSE
jgi:hypothetical protein